MKQQDKDLLLRYLCMTLPYGVKVQDELGRVNKLVIGNADLIRLYYNDFSIYNENVLSLPLLRPMSSMTEEEKNEYKNIDDRSYSCPIEYAHIPASDRINWLLKKHFDFLGLIPKGLAIEVCEENNPYNTEI